MVQRLKTSSTAEEIREREEEVERERKRLLYTGVVMLTFRKRKRSGRSNSVARLSSSVRSSNETRSNAIFRIETTRSSPTASCY